MAAGLLGISGMMVAGMMVAGARPAPAETGGQPAPGYIDPGYLLIKDLLAESRKERRAAAEKIAASGDRGLVFGIVDTLFFIPKPLRKEAFEALKGLTGETAGDSYWDWVEFAGQLGEELRPTAGYDRWKVVLLSKIDSGYRDILYQGAPTQIRLEEVVPGGVRIDGIPALDDPPMVSPSEARYLEDDEQVFGVVVGDRARAYPLRFLDWHEMLNDRVGDQAITLSYCTLCGSGVLYATDVQGGPAWRFGTSGLLYRSNKLMFDRRTRTLWSNLYGEPVIGRLAASPEDHRLEILPMTRTSWADWRQRHPETMVVQLTKELKREGRKFGFDYRPGKADQAREGVSFPVWKKNDVLPPETEIYTLRWGSAVRAYPLDLLAQRQVINDRVGDRPVVLVADPETGAVRAYGRAGSTQVFGPQPSGRRSGRLLDEQGRAWRVSEQGLLPDGFEAPALERLPGHYAFWFGWYAFFPRTEVYEGPTTEAPES